MNLNYPVRNPICQTNLFGTVNPMYTSLNQKGHPGIDFEAPSGTALYSPVDGLASYVTDVDGGDGIWIRVTAGGQNYNVILWHLFPKGDPIHPFMIPTTGAETMVSAGQLLAYTDNSGAPLESTGPHLHVGVMPCNSDWTATDYNNGYLGCVDPMPFFNGVYADTLLTTPPTLQQESTLLGLMKQFLGLLLKKIQN